MVALGFGRIIWAVYPGDRGGGKPRPMILLTPRSEIARTGNALAVVCSTDFTEPLRDNEVFIPTYADSRHCPTGLRSRTVAICDWIDEISVDKIRPEHRGGLVPRDVMKAICDEIGIPLSSDRS